MLQIRYNTQNLGFLVLEVSWRNSGRILSKLKNEILHFLPHFWYLYIWWFFFSTCINRASCKCINIFWKIFKSDFWYPKNLILWLQYVTKSISRVEIQFQNWIPYELCYKQDMAIIYLYIWKGVIETESCIVHCVYQIGMWCSPSWCFHFYMHYLHDLYNHQSFAQFTYIMRPPRVRQTFEAPELWRTWRNAVIRREVSHQQFLSLMKIIPYTIFLPLFDYNRTLYDVCFCTIFPTWAHCSPLKRSCGLWSCFLFHHPNKQSRSHLDFVIKQLLVGLSEQNYLAFVVLTTLMSLVSKLAELRRS